MSEFISGLNRLNQLKDTIIIDVREINTKGVTRTQAQNLREYAVQSGSIEEILLYIDYQCAREKKLVESGGQLKKLVETHKDKSMEVIRYMMGVFARHVMIQSKGVADNE